MRKNVNAHRTLYMPVWELGELWDAVNLLSLNISSQELSNRYQQLGGVPRYCLQTESDDYQQGLVEIEEAIEKIKTFEDVQACFEKSMPTNLVVHRLLYYFPDTRSRRTATLRFGSDMIGQEIFKRLRVKLDREREKLILWLDGAGKASTFQGWLFETVVHEKLITGGDFTYVQLDQQRQKQSTRPLGSTSGLKPTFLWKWCFGMFTNAEISIVQVHRLVYPFHKSAVFVPNYNIKQPSSQF
ncbi:hypothetical protein LEN26_010055 [Aphanomyces euteiches]|nr:hypothetical protein LEN26_010054 [Aphanomyces euteiches]KAH9122919.1 hypothetical protein LEN26_010055 [Aphanomyces euteiches]